VCHTAAFRSSPPGPRQGPSSQAPLHCISDARTLRVENTNSHRSLRFASVGGIVWGPERPITMQVLPALGHMQRNCSYATRCAACGGSHLSGGSSTPREQPRCCGCGGNYTANYRGCVKWKKAKAALAKQALDRGRKSAATTHLTAPKKQRAVPSAERMELGERWNHVVRGGRVVKATTPPTTIPNPSFQPVTETSEKPKVTARRPGLRSLSPNTQQPLSWLLGSLRRKQPRVSKLRPLNPLPRILWSQTEVPPPHSRKFLNSSITYPTCMCGADSSASHIHLLPSYRGSPPSGCPEDPHSLCDGIW